MSDIGSEELTENIIDNAQFAEILMLCDQYGIEYEDNDEITEEQLKSKLKELVPSEKEKSKAQFHVYMLAANEGFVEDIKEIAKNVQKEKEKALKLFSKLMDLVSDEEFNNQILLGKELEKRYEDFKDKIQQRCKDIKEKECTIVVTGETSAGKSSVMNLILGDDILPVSALQCTGAICRLRYSEIKQVVVKPRRGEEKKFEFSNKEKFKETVKDYTRVVPGDEKDAIEFVDLYWPIPLKLRNVVFVDTPGVSDNDTLTQRLYDYLPNAMAFIYILNSTNDGGIQKDRIVRILERQKRNRCKVFNPETTLFICNKWDEVGMEEQDRVKTYIKRQLASTWPDLHNAPLITFSVQDIIRTIRRNIRCCEYEELHSRLLSLIRVGFRDELMSHLRWIREFAERIIYIVESQVCFFPKNETERNEYIAKIKTELAKVEADFQKDY